MNWKYVFNSNRTIFGHINKAARAASDVGYKFMAFNDIIYFLVEGDTRMEVHDTGLRVTEDGDIQ